MSEEAHNEGGRPGAEAAAAGATLDASTNISHTNIAQMTDSAVPAPAPAPADAKWSCDVCTYENFPLSRKCTMCRAAKPLLNEDIFRLQDGASALPTHGCDAEAVAERLKPLRISSPQGQPGASAASKWPCPTCTYENWPKAQRCAMCGGPAPAPAPPSPPRPPSPHPADARPRVATGQVNEQNVCNNQNASIHELDANRRSKRRANNADWIWLQACLGVVEGDSRRVDAFLRSGGSAARALTPAEVQLLDRASAFDAGHTLVHLAIRFQRQEILSTLLSRISGGGPGLKRSPSYIAPDLASAIRRHIASCVRYKKGGFPCRYINEFCTFYLPAEIEELPAPIQEQLFTELLDRDAQETLERQELINWSPELAQLGSRLHALWNRSAGDCLPDAASQAAYGVFDRGNTLRGAMADTLALAQRPLFARWAAGERAAAARLHYAPDEAQLRAEWARLLAAAARPGAALRPLHVWALAHALRRPLLVLGEELVRSACGDPLGYAGFRGLYLPLLWDRGSCAPDPLCLAYTRGHFSALVPLAGAAPAYAYLPLADRDGELLPVHFLDADEAADPEAVVRRWTAARELAPGLLAARLRLRPRPLLQAQMLEEWLNHYRRLAQQTRGPFPPRLQSAADFSSDAESDEE